MVEQLPIEVVVRHIEECGYLPIGCLQFVLRRFPAQVHVWCECQNAGSLPLLHATISFTTFPFTSVSRISRPA
jgi:hypothetical protein